MISWFWSFDHHAGFVWYYHWGSLAGGIWEIFVLVLHDFINLRLFQNEELKKKKLEIIHVLLYFIIIALSIACYEVAHFYLEAWTYLSVLHSA